MEKSYSFSIVERTPAGSTYDLDRDSDSPIVLVRDMDIGLLVNKLKEQGIHIDPFRSEKKFRDKDGIITANLSETYDGKPIELALRSPPLGLEVHLKNHYHSDEPSDPMEIRMGMRYASESGIICTLKYDPKNEVQCRKAELAVRKTQKEVYEQLHAKTPLGKTLKDLAKALESDPKLKEARANFEASLLN